ncbi:SsgA family sporulation/cell division regulator [Streptomyces phytohabitans]|uniref:SsgA family sporulation/cell division regulator n=1 Tax=Streptomyces phytohabitans TaxID=1150371 RepID=UPI00345BC50A
MDGYDNPEKLVEDGLDGLATSAVTAVLDLSLVLSPRWMVPLRACFSYHAEDPYVVLLDFYRDTRKPVRWVFARHLLTAGLKSSAGQGDVRVWRSACGSQVGLRLISDQGDALFMMPATALTEWLDRTYRLVPPGEEAGFLDVDASLDRLLEES